MFYLGTENRFYVSFFVVIDFKQRKTTTRTTPKHTDTRTRTRKNPVIIGLQMRNERKLKI